MMRSRSTDQINGSKIGFTPQGVILILSVVVRDLSVVSFAVEGPVSTFSM